MMIKTPHKIKWICLFLLILLNSGLGQYHWTKNPANPILLPDNVFGVFALSDPSLLRTDNVFQMWTTGGGFVPNNPNPGVRIYHFTSPDGSAWLPDSENPVIQENQPGTWDSGHIETPHVIQVADEYWLYYVATVDSLPDDAANLRLGLATSPDGIRWTRHAANPLLSRGSALEWDAKWIESPCVFRDDSLFYLWYNGISIDWKVHVGLATSTDGLVWKKWPHNPVFSPTETTGWESAAIYAPQVQKVGEQFVMFYTGLTFNETGYDFAHTRVGMAFSPDGIHWTRHGTPVLSGTENAWDATGPFTLDWLVVEDAFWLYYISNGRIGLATSPIEISQVTQTEASVRQPEPGQNYPNPFNSATLIPYFLTEPGPVSLEIFDTLGRSIRKFDLSDQPPGHHQIVFNGQDDENRSLPGGIYFYRLRTNQFCKVNKMIYLK